MKHHNSSGALWIYLIFWMCAIYLGISWAAFQWRNPMANRMSFYRHFGSVVKFEKLPQLQEK